MIAKGLKVSKIDLVLSRIGDDLGLLNQNKLSKRDLYRDLVGYMNRGRSGEGGAMTTQPLKGESPNLQP